MKTLDKEQLEAVHYAKDNVYKGKTFGELLKEVGLIKEEFEVEKWYKEGENFLVFITSLEYENQAGYGFDTIGEWQDDLGRCNMKVEKATDKEVGEALIKEANKKYKDGDLIRNSTDERWNDRFDSKSIYWNGSELACKGKEWCISLMIGGKWAEIIPEKKELTIEERVKALEDKY